MAGIEMRVNLPLLLKQKQALLRAISNADGASETSLLEGILSLLDHIHDTLDPVEGARR
jgi:hypothetical protein